MVPVTFTLGSSKQSIVTLEGRSAIGGCGRTRSSVVGDLVMFVVVHAFDDINLSGL